MSINRSKPTIVKAATTKAPTFSPEEATRIINELAETKAFLAAQKAELDELKAQHTARADRPSTSATSAQNELVIRAFKAKGFGVVTPRVDVLTFNRWVAKGFRPIEGSRSLKVKSLRLFHKSQVRPISPEERAVLTEQSAAAVERHSKAKSAKVHQLNQGALPL
jgi:nicotinamide mononucleotide adenylyltransferase